MDRIMMPFLLMNRPPAGLVVFNATGVPKQAEKRTLPRGGGSILDLEVKAADGVIRDSGGLSTQRQRFSTRVLHLSLSSLFKRHRSFPLWLMDSVGVYMGTVAAYGWC